MIIATDLYGDVELVTNQIVEPLTESLEWMTDLFTSNNGTDVATQVRIAPRQSYQINIITSDPVEFVNAAYRSAANLWAIPLWHEGGQAVSYVESGWNLGWDLSWNGNGVIVANTTTTTQDLRGPSLVIVWVSETEYRLIDIISVESGYLVMADASPEDYAGTLYPVRVGRARVTRNANATLSEVSINLNCDDYRALDVSAPTQYLGDDILTDEPLLVGDYIADEYQSRMDMIDGETGIVSIYTPWVNNRIVRQFRTLRDGQTDAHELREFLHRRAGQYRPFWMSHYEPDMIAVGVGTGTIDVTGYDDSRDHISVLTDSGTHMFRAITGTADLGGGVTRLTIANLGITLGNVVMVSYLGLWRLAADRIEIAHYAGGIVESTIPMIEITP